MPSTKFRLLSAAALLAATLIATTPQTAAAEQPSVSQASAAQISRVISTNTFDHKFVFIAVCDSKSTECQQFLQTFALNASMLQGGWTAGVQNMHTSDFYNVEVSSANRDGLSKLRDYSGPSTMIRAVCSALEEALKPSDGPGAQIIMINRLTGAVEVLKGLTDQPTQNRAIISFIKK